MKTTFLIAFSLFLLLLSCQPEQKEKEELVEKEKTTTPNAAAEPVLDESMPVLELPFVFDSSAVKELETGGVTLPSEKVQTYAALFTEDSLTQLAQYAVRDVLKIDSLKTVGAYETYLTELDLGMTENAFAQKHAQFKLPEGRGLLLWSAFSKTMEVCPFYAGTLYFVTVFEEKTPKSTILIGEVSGGGDPPYMASTYTSSRLGADKIEVLKIDTNEEPDESDPTGEKYLITHEEIAVTFILEDEGYIYITE